MRTLLSPLRIRQGGQKFIYQKSSLNHDIQAGHSTFAHSRPDKIGTPRLLPLDFVYIILSDYRQKNPLKYYALPFLFEFVNKVHFRLVGFAKARRVAEETEAKRYQKIIFFPPQRIRQV